MDIAEKLDSIYNEKQGMSSLYDECGFSDVNLLSTYSQNLSNIVLSSGEYNKLIDSHWKGNIISYDDCGTIRESYSRLKNKGQTLDSGFCLGDISKIKSVKKTSDNFIKIKSATFQDNDSIQDFHFSNLSDALSQFSFKNSSISNISCENSNSIDLEALANCKNLQTAIFPKVKTIGKRAFQNDTVLSELDISNVTYIYNDSFINCHRLSSLNCNGVSAIGQNAFQNCSSLVDITFNSLLSIDYSVFDKCTALSSISCENIEYIGNYCFRNCINLSNICIDNVKIMGWNVFDGCSSLTDITVNQCSSIGSYCFYNCSNLKNIQCWNLQKIANGTFENCEKLENIECQKVSALGEYSFKKCKSLSSLILSSVEDVTTVNTNTFSNAYAPISVYVPSFLVNEWKESTNWSAFVQQNKVKIIGIEV